MWERHISRGRSRSRRELDLRARGIGGLEGVLKGEGGVKGSNYDDLSAEISQPHGLGALRVLARWCVRGFTRIGELFF